MKFFTTLFALLLTVSAFCQTNGTFNNGSGDQLWSNPENWSGNVAPSFDGAAILRNQDAILDVDTTVARLDLANNAVEDRTLSNTDDSILTLLGTANNYIVLRCRPTDTPASLILDNHIKVFNPNFNEQVAFATTGAAGNKIIFSENSTLELAANLRPSTAAGTSIEFNGTLIGERNLILRDDVNVSFGATADHSTYEGNMIIQDIEIVSDITIENGFLPAGRGLVLQADGTPDINPSLTINGVNTFAGNINRNGQGGNYIVNFNANQENMGTVRMINDGSLTLNIDPSVTALHFDCSNNFEWTPSSTLFINGFQSGLLRFGEADTCLTAAQLTQIDAGVEVFLDENGFLVSEAGNPNNAPTVANALANVTMDEGFGTDMIDVSAVFADADGDALTYSAASSDEGVATVSISGNMLSVTEAGIGTTTITITANDGNGGTVTNAFDYTINMVDNPNNAPTVVNALADVTMEEGFGTDMIDISGVFTDADGDALTYTATSSDEAVVTVSVTANTATITEAGIGTSTITITADDGNGGMVSNSFDYTVDMMNAVNDFNPIAGLQAMPNPTTDGLLTLTYTETIQNGQVKVYNTIGALVQQTTIRATNQVNLNLRDTPSEMYLIMVEDIETGQRSVVKVLKK